MAAEKKHCRPCNKEISITNWSKHLLTKVHSKNVELLENSNSTTLTDVNTGANMSTQTSKPSQTILSQMT